jgi:hypothetical protein
MSYGNELSKAIDKSQADIDAAIATINASGIENGIKNFAISCIKLAVWPCLKLSIFITFILN